MGKLNNIDFELIWRKLNGHIEEDEERIFLNWLDESQSNRSYFEKVKFFYQQGRIYNESHIDSQNAWSIVEAGLSRPKSIFHRFRAIASVAAMLALLFSVYWLVENRSTTKMVAHDQVVIPHGVKKARLIMDDGQQVDLSDGTSLELLVGGTTIANEGTTLVYEEGSIDLAEDVPLSYNTLEIARGQEYYVELSDGTKVWLNSESTLRFPVQFAQNERRVELTGEAYFEVASNENHPFYVVADQQVVEVTGTAFNINAYAGQDLIYTTLVEGRVEVYVDNHSGHSQVLSPGHQSSFSKGTLVLSQRKVEVFEYVAWKEGWFSFYNQSLDVMMVTLSRWYDVDYRFERDNLKEIRFTGDIRRYENLERLLELLEKTNEVTFVLEDEILVIN
jgi:ferric-dicitrate binding protein FerR (iron transport regulator)